MRWLIIALLISVVGLLAGGRRGGTPHSATTRKLKHQSSKGDAAVWESPETSDLESES